MFRICLSHLTSLSKLIRIWGHKILQAFLLLPIQLPSFFHPTAFSTRRIPSTQSIACIPPRPQTHILLIVFHACKCRASGEYYTSRRYWLLLQGVCVKQEILFIYTCSSRPQKSRLYWTVSSSLKVICEIKGETAIRHLFQLYRNEGHLQVERNCLTTCRSSPQVAVLTELRVLLRQKVSPGVPCIPSDMFGLLILIRAFWMKMLSNNSN